MPLGMWVFRFNRQTVDALKRVLGNLTSGIDLVTSLFMAA